MILTLKMVPRISSRLGSYTQQVHLGSHPVAEVHGKLGDGYVFSLTLDIAILVFSRRWGYSIWSTTCVTLHIKILNPIRKDSGKSVPLSIDRLHNTLSRRSTQLLDARGLDERRPRDVPIEEGPHLQEMSLGYVPGMRGTRLDIC
jgi:hypothetical protein